MNSFAWLHILCWCSLLCGFVSSLVIYQSPGDGTSVGSLRREKPLFKAPRVSFGSSAFGHAFAHPWQLMPPMRTSRHHPLYWKASGDEEELFLREKRKLLLQNNPGLMSNDQSDEPSLEIEIPTVPSTKEEPTTTTIGSVPEIRNFGFHNLGFRNKALAASPLDKSKLANTFWNAVYNPLPYGAPRSIQTSDEAEAIFRQKQASGLPFARTATREKERERAEFRLPIPDSEIPSPGHYRQPVNESLLQASYNPQIPRPRLPTPNGENPTGRTVNVEAFRILMEIIKSLRNMNEMYHSTTTSPSSLVNEEVM